MSSHLLRPTAVLVLSALAIGLAPAPAAAQSQSDLRRENERLRTLTDDLGRELEALKAELESLRAENERLRRLLAAAARTVTAGSTPPAPPESPPVSIDETQPGASPRALFAAIANDYEAALGDLEPGEPGDATRAAYLRDLRRWTARVNRQMTMSIEWHVRPVGTATRTARGFVLRVRAVDPETGTELGDPFDVFLTRAQASRLQVHLDRHDADELVLAGTLRPRVLVNEERMSEGAFSNPPLVGPFAEFGFGVNVQTLLPADEEDEEQAATAPPADEPGGDDG